MARGRSRRLAIGVAASAATHAVLLAWLSTRTLVAPRAPLAAPASVEIEVVAPVPVDEPLEVALVVDPPVVVPDDVPNVVEAARVAPNALPPSRAPSEAPAAAVAAPSSSEITVAPGIAAGTEAPAPRPPGERSKLAMRGGERPNLALPRGRWDALDHPPKGTTPEKAETTGMLRESGGGTHTSDQGVFVAKVNPDGTVDITDRPNVRVGIALPRPKSLGGALTRWYDSDKGRFGEGGDTDMGKQIQVTSGARTDPGAPDDERSGDRAPTAIVPVLGGSFDVTDWLMRRNGDDPYASRKLALLDGTRAERAQIGGKHRAQQLKRSAQIMQRNLEALWTATADPQARKQALFELWDDCAETGDPALVEAGQAARRLVIGAIRARFPAGSPHAYTAAELTALARAKRSTAAFQPYEPYE